MNVFDHYSKRELFDIIGWLVDSGGKEGIANTDPPLCVYCGAGADNSDDIIHHPECPIVKARLTIGYSFRRAERATASSEEIEK